MTNRIWTTGSNVGAVRASLSNAPKPGVDMGKRERDARALKSGTLRTVLIGSWEGISDLEAPWNSLVDRSPDCSVFQAFQWHLCWWRAFGGPHEPFVILAYADSRLVGIAPMMITRQREPAGRARRELHFIGSINHASDYCDFITDPDVPEALEALLEEICTRSEAFYRINLSHFPSHSPNQARTLEYFKSRGAKISVEVQAHALTRILGDGQADLKAANKSSLKRHTGFFQKSSFSILRSKRFTGNWFGSSFPVAGSDLTWFCSTELRSLFTSGSNVNVASSGINRPLMFDSPPDLRGKC